MSTRDDAIVLHARPYGDADAIVALFARHNGRVNVFARGARSSKRRDTPLVPTYEISLELNRRPSSELYTARAIDLQKTHTHITENLERLAAANVMLELLREMFRDGESDPRIYGVAVHTLGALETEDPLATLLAFEHTLLESLGIGESRIDFREHTRAFEHLRGRPLPAREFFLTVKSA